ncbi:MAG: phosphopantetheine-binding protein [Desulfobacterales bacterium]|nr:phosphopantetheine-binding protein [Desulfobacterales bacterium]
MVNPCSIQDKTDTIKEQVIDVVSEIIEIDRKDIADKTDVNIFEVFDVDSLLGLEIVAEIEKVFDIRVDDDDIVALDTIDDILNLVSTLLK